jgi:23S rRNA (uracil1939-C5)-methyltransferase
MVGDVRAHTFELAVSSLAPGGDGVAHVNIDGERRAVFVAGAAPGDVVRVEVDSARRPARGRLLAVVKAGADRVEAACPWVARCGGCDWMHLSPRAQAAAHVEHARAALPAAWREAHVETHAAEETLAYRVRTRVHAKAERRRIVVGMHEARTHDAVEVDSCAVLDPTLERARRGLAALLDGSTGRGDVLLALGAGRKAIADVAWRGEVAAACFGRLERAVAAGDLAGARVTMEGARRPAVVGDATPWMNGADDAPLRLAPGGFGQASERMNRALARHVAEVAGHARAERATELFAGAGNLTVMLAPVVKELTAVESSAEACAAARANLAARGATHVHVVEGDALAHAWPPSTRLLVLDPPRTGARAVAERLPASHVRRVVYVSCDTQTLARDLAILEPAYALSSVATFEMFPQTSHVEVVVALERR